MKIAVRKPPIHSVEASKSAGKRLREKVPRASHAAWHPRRKGRDVVAMLEASNRSRVASLIPVRYGRMLHSPFAFLRGAAVIMASDLARTPVSGLRVQACGDAHLMNFGAFATPERHVVFDVNDFDETLPAPWEWDVKRLAASVTVAARHLSLSKTRSSQATLAALSAYRESMQRYAGMPALERWYQRIDATEVVELALRDKRRGGEAPAHPVTEHLFPKLTEQAGVAVRIKEQPPLVFHPARRDRIIDHVRQFLVSYRKTLPDDRRVLMERYSLVDVAVKVVGVGSVGTRCAVALLMADERDSLFLQFKEARASVLEPYARRSRYPNHGQRVVEGQRLMQSASDIFLGWSRIKSVQADFYIRQLRDRKTSADVDAMDFAQLFDYAQHCGQALARAHAKAGDAAAISGYLGRSEAFDIAVSRFAAAYADQTEADFQTLEGAARAGKIPVEDI